MTLKSDLKKASYTVLDPVLIGGTTHNPIRLMPDKYISLSALKKICDNDFLKNTDYETFRKRLRDALSELEQEEKTMIKVDPRLRSKMFGDNL